MLEESQILGKGARGPNPTGMSVLTFGVHVVEVAVDVETGEVQVERVAAIHDVGRIVNPLGASSQVEGGVIQGIGHTLSEERLLDPETGGILTTSLDAYRMPTIADVPEIICEFVDRPDEHLTNLGSKGLGEPPIVPIAAAIANAIRDATGADVHELPISREEMLRALEARRRRNGVELLRPSDVAELDGGVFVHGGTEVVPLLREGLLEAERLVDVRGVVPRGIHGNVIGAGTTLAELEVEPAIPEALREACRLAASPQLRNMGSLGGNLLQVDALLVLAARLPVPPPRRRPLPRAGRRASRARDLRERLLRLGASVRRRGGARRAGRAAADEPARARGRGALPASGRGRPEHDDARGRRADPRGRAAPGGGERLPQGDGPQAVVVPAGRRRRRSARRRLDADRARRRRADPVADRERRGSRRGHAAAADRVEGAARASARPPRPRRARLRGLPSDTSGNLVPAVSASDAAMAALETLCGRERVAGLALTDMSGT